MVWILDVADLLLDKTTEKSRQYVTDVFGEQPRYAWLLSDGVEVQVPVTNLKKGDRIALVGNTLLERLQLFAHVEALLQQRFPEHQLVVRNLAWSADTAADASAALGGDFA